MNEQQQPKEYIITEEQLRNAVTLTDWDKISDLCSAIRSRPHPAPAAGAQQQRIEQVIMELEREIRRCESINGATIDTEGRAFWRGCMAQAKDTIALLQAGDQHE